MFGSLYVVFGIFCVLTCFAGSAIDASKNDRTEMSKAPYGIGFLMMITIGVLRLLYGWEHSMRDFDNLILLMIAMPFAFGVTCVFAAVSFSSFKPGIRTGSVSGGGYTSSVGSGSSLESSCGSSCGGGCGSGGGCGGCGG